MRFNTMRSITHRLICGMLATSLLASACSSPYSSSAFTLDLNNFPDTPNFAGNVPAPPHKKTETRTQTYTAPSYTSSSSGSDFWEGLLAFAGLALCVAGGTYNTFSEVESAKKTGWTGEYQPEWDRMTRGQAIEYINEHPETWTPVYVVPSE